MSESNNYHGEERRWQPPPSKMPKFLREHAAIWLLGTILSTVGTAVWLGGLAYIDTRHVQRSEFTGYIKSVDQRLESIVRNADRRFEALVYTSSEIRLLDKIESAEGRVLELQMYNRFGEPSRNKEARSQMIDQKKKDISGWSLELKSLAEARAASG